MLKWLTVARRIRKALEYAERYGMIEGDHHRTWVIDQMVRALLGCPIETYTRRSSDLEFNGPVVPLKLQRQGENAAYKKWIVTGEEYDDWDEGIAP